MIWTWDFELGWGGGMGKVGGEMVQLVESPGGPGK